MENQKPTTNGKIKVYGARAHNLKNVNVSIPRNKLTVITGVSGSGKSSLAFDTIFAEGQRRFLESLSGFARQFLANIEKPDVDYIEGLAPAIVIDEKSAARSPRSTVGTMSETYDYLRILFANLGEPKIINLSMADFSFNTPKGACPTCHGLGKTMEIDAKLVIPNENLTLNEGAIRPWARLTSQSHYYQKVLKDLSLKHDFSLNDAICELPDKIIQTLFLGDGEFPGIIKDLKSRYLKTDSDYMTKEIEKYMIEKICSSCHGKRLRSEILKIKILDKSIVDVTSLTISETRQFLAKIKVAFKKAHEKKIAETVVEAIDIRLKFLEEVGLTYLTLDRTSETLAGGEAQRVRLATQLASALSGVIYILDEPSIGLHPRDQVKLISVLQKLRDLGNTLIVVEHDEAAMKNADWIIDMGPLAGEFGGEVIAEGTYDDILKSKKSLTGLYLSGKKIIPDFPLRKINEKTPVLKIVGAGAFNLKNIDVEIPLGRFVCVTGVSGSGKSTLINEILAKSLTKHFYRSKAMPGKHLKIEGIENINKVINVDQTPIGRTPRSNPVTYTNVFGEIRELFVKTDLAVERKYKAARFSFNLKGGRCEECAGEGMIKLEMHLLPDLYVPCPVCNADRFNAETLEIKWREKNIAEILQMTVDQAIKFFKGERKVTDKLQVLSDVGLGYLKLGQPATTLSGGEAQRVKLATELMRPETGNTLYILDEPTRGLHFEDISKLLIVLERLVAKGNTVLVVEHDSKVIQTADWVIDLGPDGGVKGGEIVAVGTPKDIKKNAKSWTGKYL